MLNGAGTELWNSKAYASAYSSAFIGNPAGVLPSWGPKDLSEFRAEVFAIFAVLAVGVKKKTMMATLIEKDRSFYKISLKNI